QGTLGLITEATFRLHPLPAAVAWVTAEFGPAERAGAVAAVAAAAGSPLVPSAGELDWPGGAQRPLRLGVLLGGTGPGGAGAGALYACLDPGTSDADAARFVTMLRERVAGALGSAGPRGPRAGVVVLTAPEAVLAAAADRATIPGLALMRAVKDQFDPD